MLPFSTSYLWLTWKEYIKLTKKRWIKIYIAAKSCVIWSNLNRHGGLDPVETWGREWGSVLTFIESPKLLRILEALTASKVLTVLYMQTNSLDRGILSTLSKCWESWSYFGQDSSLNFNYQVDKKWNSSMFYLIVMLHLLRLNKFVSYKRKICMQLSKKIRWYANFFLLIWWYAVE